MAEKEKKEFSFEIMKGFDHIIEEGPNTSVNLRKISWNGRPAKLDLRKWSYTDGEERMLKGCTLSEEGGNELACVMVECGYGNTDRLMQAISKRSDFKGIPTKDPYDSNVDDDEEEEYYDPNLLLN